MELGSLPALMDGLLVYEIRSILTLHLLEGLRCHFPEQADTAPLHAVDGCLDYQGAVVVLQYPAGLPRREQPTFRADV